LNAARAAFEACSWLMNALLDVEPGTMTGEA